MEELNIIVHKDRLLIENVKGEKKSSIIDVIEDEQGALTGFVLKTGKLVEDVKEGETILYKEMDAFPITFKDKKYFILREYDVIATI